MGEVTTISWCDRTFNPWEGCSKVSPGCLNCYAETRNHRFGGDNWGKGKPRRRTSAANWKLPVKWNREHDRNMAAGYGSIERPRVFCASLADWLDDEVPIEWLADLLNLIADTPNLDWLLLTKRPEHCFDRINAATRCAHYKADGRLWTLAGLVPHNVWIGTSVEDQQRADERIPQLLKIPAKVRFLSVEPMLGPVDFGFRMDQNRSDPAIQQYKRESICGQLHWVIFGGESGKGARLCNVEWIREGVRQCKAAGVAAFVKQDSGLRPGLQGRIPDELWLKEFPV